MLSVLIFCHDKREGEFFCRLCTKSVKVIGKEALYNFIVSDSNYNEADIRIVKPPDLIIAEVVNRGDLNRVRYIRTLFAGARLLLLSNNQISPEYYIVPEISPDILLLKPYVYSKAVETVHKILLWCYRDRGVRQGKDNLLEMQSGGEVYYFDYAEVYYLEARDKKIIVHMREQELSFYSSLQKLEKNLPEYFIRCHRSYIVNFMFIQKVDLTNSIFYLNEKAVIPISQKYKVRLTKILQKYKDSGVNLG